MVIGFYKVGWPYGEFSNFYLCEFTVGNIKFSHTEQYIMYTKAMLFNDIDTAELILRTTDPMDCKRLGRRVKPYVDTEWRTRCEELVFPGLYAKFSQNPELKELLLGTGDNLLAECSPRDTIWGIGMSKESMLYQYPERWRGENLLGTLLMRVRSALRVEETKV